MHKQFVNLDDDLKQVSLNADVRFRVEKMYGGYSLSQLV